MDDIISNIQNSIKMSGITLTELSSRSRISISYLSRLNRKQKKMPSILVILRLSKALSINVETLIYGLINNDGKKPIQMFELLSNNHVLLNDRVITMREKELYFKVIDYIDRLGRRG